MNKSWTAVSFNVTNALVTRVKPKYITIPPNLFMQIVIDLDEELYKVVTGNPTWLARLQEGAKKKFDESLAKLVTFVQMADLKAGDPGRTKPTSPFVQQITAEIQKMMRAGSDEMAAEAKRILDDFIRGQAALRKYRFVCAGKIFVASVGVAVGAATAVASGGALSPLAGYGFARGGLAIVQECVKLGMSADKTAKVVQFELRALKTIMADNYSTASKPRQAGHVATEIGLNVASKAIGVDTPSLKNCKTAIEAHKVNIAKLDDTSNRLSRGLYAAMDSQEEWQKAFNQARRTLPAHKVGKVVLKLEEKERALHRLLENIIKVNESVNLAWKRQTDFEVAIDALTKGMPGWVGKVDTAIGLASDVFTGVIDAGSAFESAMAAVIAVESTAATELMDAA